MLHSGFVMRALGYFTGGSVNEMTRYISMQVARHRVTKICTQSCLKWSELSRRVETPKLTGVCVCVVILPSAMVSPK